MINVWTAHTELKVFESNWKFKSNYAKIWENVSSMENPLFREETTYVIDKRSSAYDLNLLLYYWLILKAYIGWTGSVHLFSIIHTYVSTINEERRSHGFEKNIRISIWEGLQGRKRREKLSNYIMTWKTKISNF